MKKALVLALCVVGFILIAAPTAVERAPLFVNGKQIGEAVLINGIIAVSVENVAKAGGATITLQPYFSRTANRFVALGNADTIAKKAENQKWTPSTTPAGVPAVQAGELKQNEGAWKLAPVPGQAFRVAKAGEISSHVFEFEGKAYLPVADLARALGMINGNNTWTGKPIQLHSSANGILIGL